ncbi:MAG TPA: response regulator [Candidatus Acidoferrales bacterium]|nr:response regulator [Candidatus Acidoferrales bacterium]
MPKILVADDNANIQKMVVLSFEERGIQVVSVGNGEAAVRRIPDLNPDLILADIFMPVRNGYEVCEFVKKDERFSHVPVILLVGAFDPLDEKEARRVGADGVLKKPFVPPDPLIAMVMSALEKNPKVAAELAKAKEVKEVLPPEPVPHLEIPSRAEPKPLPEYPEPSPEEAALVYGFGKGKRTLDEDRTSAADEPKAPLGEIEDVDDHEFDGASTTRDWRRTAMDFEVPEDANSKPAFTADEGPDAATFPSERDYPPRHVRHPDSLEESEPAAQSRARVNSEAKPVSLPFSQTPTAPVVEEAEAESEATHHSESASQPETAAPSNEPHWMDALGPSQSKYTDDALYEPPSEPAEAEKAENPPEVMAEAPAPNAVPVETADSRAEDNEGALVEEPDASLPVARAAREDPFIADEHAKSEPNEPWFAPTPSVFEPIHDSAPVPVASATSNAGSELEPEQDDTVPTLVDPDLERPLAVHVTPEPLLLDEEPRHEHSQYGSTPQEVPPLHSFFAPASGDPVVEAPVTDDASVRDEVSEPPLDASFDESNERIPTGPPPNREALADIPFLVPPVDFQPDAQEKAAANPETVDTVVRRVLEKLEPRLHDLLSQGVLKPLVENLLQGELSKKEK